MADETTKKDKVTLGRHEAVARKRFDAVVDGLVAGTGLQKGRVPNPWHKVE